MRACLPIILASLLAACGDGPAEPECSVDGDCAAGEQCVDGRCVPEPDAGGSSDAGPPVCGPGQLAQSGGCADECGSPASVPCAAGQVCDVAGGSCVPAGTVGLLPQSDVPCGAGLTCRAGTECSVNGACEPIPACRRVACTNDGQTCWGRDCDYQRPAATCAPPTLERLNAPEFLRGGDGGAFDLEFDDACAAYAVTIISGVDYLRQLEPDGALTVWDGVANLNMGEVAVLRPISGEFGDPEDAGEVALTYICCATCGCLGADPQGVARLDREGPPSLPMVLEATPSQGTAPWGEPALDTGPYGLTWGNDRTLYVGNVMAEGDFVRADLDAGTSTELHRFDARVVASSVYGRASLVVALAGGELHLASTLDDATRPLVTLEGEVTSLFRDPLTGHLFVALARDLSGAAVVLELDASGAEVGRIGPFPGPVRIARSPDGGLYTLDSAFPAPAGMIERRELPATRE